MTPAQQAAAEAAEKVYAEIVRCAITGQPMTHNDRLARMVGGTVSRITGLLRRLEAENRIVVHRYQRSRQIRVPHLGIETAPCSNMTPHWKTVPALLGAKGGA